MDNSALLRLVSMVRNETSYMHEEEGARHFVTAVEPTRRDIWKILRGKWVPFLRIMTDYEDGVVQEEDPEKPLFYKDADIEESLAKPVYLSEIAGKMPISPEQRNEIAEKNQAIIDAREEHPAMKVLREEREEAEKVRKIWHEQHDAREEPSGNEGSSNPSKETNVPD